MSCKGRNRWKRVVSHAYKVIQGDSHRPGYSKSSLQRTRRYRRNPFVILRLLGYLDSKECEQNMFLKIPRSIGNSL